MRFRGLGRELAHPLPIAAVAALLVNDHVLKGSGLAAAWLTGKLSDFAGLFLFPIVLFVLLDALTLRRASHAAWRTRSALFVGWLTIALFCAIKLWPPANRWLSAWLGPIWLDPTDLIALPAAAGASLWLSRTRSATRPRAGALRFASFALSAFACLATSRPRLVRDYPVWQIESLGARRIGCAIVEAWISKSGKEGVGVTLGLSRASAGPCRVALSSARLSAGSASVAAASLPAPVEIGERAHLYVPFAFDNEALWNDGVRDGRLELALECGADRELLAVNLKHVWHGPHRIDERQEPLVSPDAAPAPPYEFAEPPP